MLERQLHALRTVDVGAEDIAATRDRFKARFPRGATRRMTQLGLLIGSVLDELAPQPGDAIVYASTHAETRALEDYIDSFPTASPTLFQTSIHPSAVQQTLIGRQQPIGEFFPLSGGVDLAAQMVQTALLSPAPRVLVCGGEERGTWLLDQRMASERSFAFALALDTEATGALARVSLIPAADGEAHRACGLPEFFDALAARRGLNFVTTSGQRLILTWL